MKKTLTLILALVLTAAFSVCGFAEGIEKTGCRDFASFFDADELSRVLSDTGNDTFMNQMEAAGSEETMPYKRYDVTKPDFIYRLADGEKLADMISSEYRWMVPGHNSLAMVVLTEENKWHTIGYGKYMQEILDEGIVQKDIVDDEAVNSAIEDIVSKSSASIEDIICVSSVEYFTDFVCVITADKTYLIPFGGRPDFTGLTNGTAYSPDEATDILLQTVDVIVDEEDNHDENEMQVGGIGVRVHRAKNNTNNPVNLFVLIFPAAVVAAAIVVFIIVRIKAKSNNARLYHD